MKITYNISNGFASLTTVVVKKVKVDNNIKKNVVYRSSCEQQAFDVAKMLKIGETELPVPLTNYKPHILHISLNKNCDYKVIIDTPQKAIDVAYALFKGFFSNNDNIWLQETVDLPEFPKYTEEYIGGLNSMALRKFAKSENFKMKKKYIEATNHNSLALEIKELNKTSPSKYHWFFISENSHILFNSFNYESASTIADLKNTW